MMIGWPRCFAAESAIARMVMSVGPPAGHGTIRVIGLVGNSWADAALARTIMPMDARTVLKPRCLFILPLIVNTAADDRRQPQHSSVHVCIVILSRRSGWLLCCLLP